MRTFEGFYVISNVFALGQMFNAFFPGSIYVEITHLQLIPTDVILFETHSLKFPSQIAFLTLNIGIFTVVGF